MSLDSASALDVLAGPLNLRDVGGHRTTDGRRVRTGVVYRGAALRPRDDAVRQALAQLGLRTVYDLRTADERSSDPDELPAGTQLVVLDVFGSDADLAPARLKTALASGAQLEDLLGDGGVVGAFESAYRQLVRLPSACESYRRLFTELGQDTTGPAIFHCTAGNDRTGWGAAALLLWLGVPLDVVTADFLASNANTRLMFQTYLDAFVAGGVKPEVVEPLFGVQESYLAAVLGEVTTTYGDVDTYFAEGLAITLADQDQLRRRLLA